MQLSVCHGNKAPTIVLPAIIIGTEIEAARLLTAMTEIL